MNNETKYQFQKRIKELEQDASKLRHELYIYRTCVIEIYDGVCDVMRKNQSISMAWILERAKRCFK